MSPRLAQDERGAIMVLGLFFCCISAAGLWYVAGLGDAILMRERTQEAADAVAFTTSAVHARGMNLIVMLNLTMAAVLSIRVALKALLTIEIVAETVFGLICLNPFGGEWACAALPLVGDAIGFTQDAITTTREPIDMALESMSATQKVIADAIPAAAEVAGAEVGRKYAPGVKLAVGVPQPELLTLPVDEGTPSYLCKEAGAAVGDLIGDIMDKAGLKGVGAAAKWIGDRVGSVVGSAPGYFCELPGASAPDHSAEFQSAAADHCKQLKDQDVATNGDKSKFDEAKCVKDQVASMTSKANGKMGSSSSKSNWSAMTPKKLVASYGNGCPANETIGAASGDMAKLAADPKMVAIGHFGHAPASARPSVTSAIGAVAGAVPDGFAQAEFFYDCHGPWGHGACNADGEDAMWHFRWRPRLVLFDDTHSLFKEPIAILGRAYQGQMTLDVVAAAAQPIRTNEALLRELEADANDATGVFIH